MATPWKINKTFIFLPREQRKDKRAIHHWFLKGIFKNCRFTQPFRVLISLVKHQGWPQNFLVAAFSIFPMYRTKFIIIASKLPKLLIFQERFYYRAYSKTKFHRLNYLNLNLFPLLFFFSLLFSFFFFILKYQVISRSRHSWYALALTRQFISSSLLWARIMAWS